MKKDASIAIVMAGVLFIIAIGGYVLFHQFNASMSGHPTASNNRSNASVVNNAVLITKTSPSLGQYLAESDGQALYTYGGDTPGVSNCSGQCLAHWPAYQDKGSMTNLPAGVGTIKRTDNGEIQYTYNGMPLYTFVGDSNGQVTGNGVGNFSIAKPAAATSSSSNQPTATTTTTTSGSNNAPSSNSSSNW